MENFSIPEMTFDSLDVYLRQILNSVSWNKIDSIIYGEDEKCPFLLQNSLTARHNILLKQYLCLNDQ